MNITVSPAQATSEERFGRLIAARLSNGADDLPHDVAERLRAARAQALARRQLAPSPRSALRPASAAVVSSAAGASQIGRFSGWWTRIGFALPLVALVAGLIAIDTLQDDNRASEAAEVDIALLTGDLPPAAFTDPGFAQFLKTSGSAR